MPFCVLRIDGPTPKVNIIVNARTWVHILATQKARFVVRFSVMATRKDKTLIRAVSDQKSAVPSTKAVGRPRAKHSSPDYVQMSIYIHREIRNKVKMRLFEREMEFSGLVESLLRDWLRTKA